MSNQRWRTHPQGWGKYLVTSPDGTRYEVTAHWEHSQSPIPEDGVIIDRITSGGRVLWTAAAGVLAPEGIDSEVTMGVESAVLSAEGL
jgi:hypothetical protein